MWGHQLSRDNPARGGLLLVLAILLVMLGLAIAFFTSGAELWGAVISCVMVEMLWTVWRMRHEWAFHPHSAGFGRP